MTKNVEIGQGSESSDVTTNQHTICINRNTILGHNLYDLGQGTRNKVIIL